MKTGKTAQKKSSKVKSKEFISSSSSDNDNDSRTDKSRSRSRSGESSRSHTKSRSRSRSNSSNKLGHQTTSKKYETIPEPDKPLRKKSKSKKKRSKEKSETKKIQTESLEDLSKELDQQLYELSNQDKIAKKEAQERKANMKRIKEVLAKKKMLEKAKKSQSRKKPPKKKPEKMVKEETPERKVVYETMVTEEVITEEKESEHEHDQSMQEFEMEIKPNERFDESETDYESDHEQLASKAPVVSKELLLEQLNKKKADYCLLEEHNESLHKAIKKLTEEQKNLQEKTIKETLLIVKETAMKEITLTERRIRICGPFNNLNQCDDDEPQEDIIGPFCNRLTTATPNGPTKLTRFYHFCTFCRARTGKFHKHHASGCLLAQKYKHLYRGEENPTPEKKGQAEQVDPTKPKPQQLQTQEEKPKRKFTPITPPDDNSKRQKVEFMDKPNPNPNPGPSTSASTSGQNTGILKNNEQTNEPQWAKSLCDLVAANTAVIQQYERGRQLERGRGNGRGRGQGHGHTKSKSMDRHY